MRRRFVQGALVTVLMCHAALAMGQSIPVGFSWSVDDDELTITLDADDIIDDVEVELRSDRGERVRESRDRLGMRETWEIVVDAPTRTTTYDLTVEGTCADIEGQFSYEFTVEAFEALDFEVDLDSWDPEGRRFVMTMTQPAQEVEVRVRGVDGSILAERLIPFDGAAAGAPLEVSWSQGPGQILTIDVRAVGTSGAWASRQYVPWEVQMAELVHFETGSAEISETDRPTLEGRLAEMAGIVEQVGEFVNVSLYVGGYTDTVGSASSNRSLSERRARAIASWFEDNGLSIPIFYQGFGEDVPAVDSGDEVDEPANRRALFILRDDTPPMGPDVPSTDWHRLR